MTGPILLRRLLACLLTLCVAGGGMAAYAVPAVAEIETDGEAGKSACESATGHAPLSQTGRRKAVLARLSILVGVEGPLGSGRDRGPAAARPLSLRALEVRIQV